MKSVELGKLYETLLCSPGMTEVIKVDLRMSRKTVLLLSQVVNKGLSKTEDQNFGLADIADSESIKDLKEMLNSCLDKASLTELNAKLNGLQ
jgi:hypothetical protein